MASIRIFTDSCSDLGKDIREKYGIEYLKMCTVFEGKESPADLDWTQQTPREMYDIMRGGKRILTTQVPQSEFITHFTAAMEAGDAVIYIGCALPLSKSGETGTIVARNLKERFPGGEIYCVDATNSCLGEGMLTVRAAELRDAGKSAAEIVADLEVKKHEINQFVTVGSLDMLKKSGRVKGSAAFFGNLLGVKPIIISDYNGQNVPIKKVKGRKASLDALVELIKEIVVDPASQTVYVGHADCEADALYLRDRLVKELGFADAYVNFIGPIIGACIGPDAIGVWAYGKKVETAI